MNRTRTIAVLLLPLLLLSACSFAYYNTFFNAKKYYKKAQAASPRDDGRPAAGAVNDYNTAIQKCGIIITEYKETKWVDDAVFLLAKCLYYKGNGYVQAAEKFQDILNYYPDSPFVPEAKLYLARCKRALNQDEDAYRILQELLVDAGQKELHSQALLLLAKYRLEDEDYARAEALLRQLLTDYPDSDEYEESYFLLGLTLHNQKQYSRSDEVFRDLLSSRVTRRTKLDARYYMAANLLGADQPEEALDACDKLMKDEFVVDKLSRITLLKARCLVALDRPDDARELFEKVLADASHTYLSAETSYYMADMFFRALNYADAIEYYNRVKREKNDSPFVEDAVTRSAVASQILQFQDTTRKISPEDLVNEQFKLAEYYLDVLAMPDSTLSVYERVHGQEGMLREQIVTLDSLIAAADPADTLAAARVDSLSAQLTASRLTLERYENEFSPFAMFCQVWVQNHVLKDSVAARAICDDMRRQYPDNRYTFAADDYLAGRDVSFTTVREQRAQTAYAEAVALLDTNPAAARDCLDDILVNYPDIRQPRTLYALGYVNYFALADTVAAAAWFDSLLASAQESEYAAEVQEYYHNGAFEKLDHLPSLMDTLATNPAGTSLPVEQDTLYTISPDASFDEYPQVLEEYYPPCPSDIPIFGETILDVEIFADGSIGHVSVVKSFDSSPGGLDELALTAIYKWRFSPAMLNGEPVPCRIEIPINYGPVQLQE